jgi:axial budding pattern protein 2
VLLWFAYVFLCHFAHHLRPQLPGSNSSPPKMGSGWMAAEDWPTASIIITRAVYAVYIFGALGTGAPTITFPINSQVPPVARVSIPFTFTFSASTFYGSSTLDYKLSNAPSWLSLDGSTRTLSGLPPESAANTAPIIQITASDNTGSVAMNTTLVVSGNPAPSVVIPLEDQLAALGTYSPPSSILYYPSTPFNITFNHGTFSSAALNYYAVTLDNTPLPSWITFDGASLCYSGKTPDYYSLVEPPQTWGLQLIASDVLGFAGAAIEFNIVVSNHELNFKDGFLNVNATIGEFLNFTSLNGSLYLDGNAANGSDIVNADAEAPGWLKFSNSTFSLSGTPPAGTTSFNVSVTVADIYGDIANAVVHISLNISLFSETVGSVNATIGMPFSYDIGSLLSNASDIIVSLRLDPLTPWLSFNNQTLNLSGNVPWNTQPSKINISIEATSRSSNTFDSQILTINVVSSPNRISSSTLMISAIPTARSTSTASINAATPTGTSTSKSLSRGEIAAITIPVVFFSIAAITLFCLCCKRRRQSIGRREGSPDKSEISKPITVSNQTEEELEAQDRVTSSDVCTTTTLNSKRHTAALKRHSQAMTNLVGGLSMNLRDSRSSGTRGRSYSENALSDFGSTWRYTQDSAYPPLCIGAARRSSARNTQKFSRKTSAPFSLTNRSSAELLESTITKRASKTSRSSIQQTPDFAYGSENTKQRLSQRRTPDYLGIPGFGRSLSGIGHGSQKIVAGYSALDENRAAWGIVHGISNQNPGSQSHVLPREKDSWVTMGSEDLKEQHRHSALTESTEVLNSPKRTTLKQVPKSPSQPGTARMSMSSRSSQPSSKRAVGTSPFFGGSSRTESRGISRKSLWTTRDKHLYPNSPPGRGREVLNDSLEKSIIGGLRGMKPSSSAPASDIYRDSLGITYCSPREGTRQLKDYVSQLGRRLSLSLRNSLQFSDSDSRFISAEHSPQSQHYKEYRDQGGNLDIARDQSDYSPQASASPGSFNRDRYGLDESPELSQAMGALAVIRTNLSTALANPTSPDRQSSLLEPVKERNMPSPNKPASSYGHGMVREKSLTASHFEVGSDDNADISIDGVHGAFL